MAKKTKYIPEGYHTATPYLIVNGAGRAIEFYKQAFGATEVMRIGAPGGKIGHAEVKIGDSHIMLADEHPEVDARGVAHYGGSPITLLLYVPNVDATVAAAVSAGAALTKPVEDRFYGDRVGVIKDPFGYQ